MTMRGAVLANERYPDPMDAVDIFRLSLGTAIIVVALAAVAAFEAVGSILVIAMFICPAATARTRSIAASAARASTRSAS